MFFNINNTKLILTSRTFRRLRHILINLPNYYSFKTFFNHFYHYKRKELGNNKNIPQGNLYTILFVGDTSFAESYGKKPTRLLMEKGYDYPMTKVRPLLDQSDFVICNLETPITNIKKSPFKGKKSFVHWTNVINSPIALKRNNLKAFSLANNHTLDYGIPGLKQTFKIMKEHNLNWFGAGMSEEEAKKPLIKTIQVGNRKFKFAVIGVFEWSQKYEKIYRFYAKGSNGGCCMLTQLTIRDQISRLKKQNSNTYVIVYPHWGQNYSWKNFTQTCNAHRMIKWGADLVIGHGGHSIQEIEKYKGKWILYGIGNFVFLSHGRFEYIKHPPYSYAAQLVLSDNNGILEKWLRLFPIFSNNLRTKFQPRPLNGDEFAEFVKILLDKSPLTFGEAKSISKGENEGGKYLQLKIS